MRARHLFVFTGLLLVTAASLAVTALLRASTPRAAALSAANVGFSPASSTMTAGATPVPTVDVTLTNANAVAGYEAWISFNGSVVQLSSLTDAGFLANPNPSGTPQNAVVCNTPTVTASYGYLACSVIALPSPFPAPVLPAAGSTPVPLVHARFNAAAPGTSSLSLTAMANGTPQTTVLLDAGGTPIAATLGGGSLSVTGAASTGAASVGGIGELPDLAAPPGSSGHERAIIAVVAGVVLSLFVGALILRRGRAAGG